jgi:hypothetical protein
MSKLFVPEGYQLLAQAVLRIAESQEPDTWCNDIMSPNEAAIYAKLGDEYEPYELQAAFGNEDDFRRLKIARGLSLDRDRVRQFRNTLATPESQKRYGSYRQAEKIARRAFHSGSLQFELRSLRTGQPFNVPREIWAEQNALNWFDDGQLFIPTGETTKVPFGPLIPGAPDEINFIDMPDGELFAILVPVASLEAFLHPDKTVHPSSGSGGHNNKSPGRGKKTIAVRLAAQALWPNGMPEGLAVKDRDRAICRWMRDNGHSVPDERTIRRYFNQ